MDDFDDLEPAKIRYDETNESQTKEKVIQGATTEAQFDIERVAADADYGLDDFDNPEPIKANCEATNTNKVKMGVESDGLDVRKL